MVEIKQESNNVINQNNTSEIDLGELTISDIENMKVSDFKKMELNQVVYIAEAYSKYYWSFIHELHRILKEG